MLKRLLNNHQLVFLGPVNAYLTFWTLFPLLYTAALSLTNWKIPNPSRFIGLQNYAEALTDPLFQYSVGATLTYAIVVSLLELVLAFGVAMLLNQRVLLARVARPLLVVPMVLTPVVTAMMWRYLYNPNFGPLNYMLGLVGLGPYEWYSRPETVWPSLILIDLWQWIPFPTLLILSGLHSVPEEFYEAARVDGASRWENLIHITIPLLRPLLLAALLLRFLDALKIFDSIFILTRGGPGTMTEVLSFHIYRFGLGEFFRVGYGAAMSVIVLILSLVMSLFFMRFMRQEELQSG
jgi:multiple sugar transport system permease protein